MPAPTWTGDVQRKLRRSRLADLTLVRWSAATLAAAVRVFTKLFADNPFARTVCERLWCPINVQLLLWRLISLFCFTGSYRRGNNQIFACFFFYCQAVAARQTITCAKSRALGIFNCIHQKLMICSKVSFLKYFPFIIYVQVFVDVLFLLSVLHLEAPYSDHAKSPCHIPLFVAPETRLEITRSHYQTPLCKLYHIQIIHSYASFLKKPNFTKILLF